MLVSDAKLNPAFWDLVKAGRAWREHAELDGHDDGTGLFGENLIGYNILGSWALTRAKGPVDRRSLYQRLQPVLSGWYS
jgi:hypothetical protein